MAEIVSRTHHVTNIKLVQLGDWPAQDTNIQPNAVEMRLSVTYPENFRLKFLEATAIKEGVWKEVFESAAVLKGAASSLLGKYLLWGHPEVDSQPNYPDVALGQVIGVQFDDETTSTKVLIAGWENRMPPDLLERLEKGDPLGVSVGQVDFMHENGGVFDEKNYKYTVSKIYYDHIAIVPIGACQIKDGCLLKAKTNAKANPIVAKSKLKLKLNEKQEGVEMGMGKKSTKNPATKTCHQDEPGGGGSVEPPPAAKPAFGSPEALEEYVKAQSALTDKELMFSQLEMAMDYVMNTILTNASNAFDAGDADSIVEILNWAVEQWKAGAVLMNPVEAAPVEETVPNEVTGENMNMAWKSEKSKKSQKAPDKLLYPVVNKTEEGKISISWSATVDPEEAKKAFENIIGEMELSLADLQKKAGLTDGAEKVARSILIDALKGAMPGLKDMARYETMPLDILQGIVGDIVGSSKPAVDVTNPGIGATPIEGAPSAPSPAPTVTLPTPAPSPAPSPSVKSPTPITLQKPSPTKGGGETYLELKKRMEKELKTSI